MRRRTDANQTEIVDALRRAGASVWITSALGHGFCDVVAGYRGKNFLLELKDGKKSASRTKLTPDEQRFVDSWRGTVHTVSSVDEALLVVIGRYVREADE